MMHTFNDWLDTFVAEKGIDTEHVMEVDGDFGVNFIPVACLLDSIKQSCVQDPRIIKSTIVKIDFMNGDVMHFFKHLAQAIAV